MLNNLEIEKLKEWVKRRFNLNDKDYMTFDINAEMDKALSYSENKTIIREKLKTFLKEQLTHRDIKTINEKANNEELKEILKQEEDFNKSFELSVYELKNKPQTITDKYYIPIEYIKSVARGYNKAFIFLGNAGIGKSYITRQTLSKEGVNFIESRGVSSPLALYHFLYENNKKNLTIVFDDVSGLIENSNAFSILLGILWEGVAQWNSTTEKLKIPKRFIFEGNIIIIANKIIGNNADIIKSRCLVYNLDMNKTDIIKMMYEISKTEHSILTQEERFKIVDFLKENSNNSTKNLDLRTQQKAEQLYLYSPEKWEELVKALLENNKEIEIIEYCLKSSNNIKEAEKMFISETGLSRATFYRHKNGLFSLNDTSMQVKGGLN